MRSQARLDRRRARNDGLRDVARPRVIIERVELLGGVGCTVSRFVVRRIARGEAQRALDSGFVPLGVRRALELLLFLPVREQRGVTRLAAMLVERIRIRRTLVLERRVTVAPLS